MGSPTVIEIKNAVESLRAAHAANLANVSQSDIVLALSGLADACRDRNGPFLQAARQITEPFPFEMAEITLDALLDSLAPDALWSLIDSEKARDISGYPIVGHIIAGNTPFIAWTSIIRALLVRSASLVKLPSGPSAAWGRLFIKTLQEAAPALGHCVAMLEWPGGTRGLETALCESVDLVVAYGSDETIAQLKSLCLHKPFLGYGHRVSFGLVLAGADIEKAAGGFATDVLLYDQGGCLSPHAIYVEGGPEDARRFAAIFADALKRRALELPLPNRDFNASRRVREARSLARMEEGTGVWEGDDLRWTVVTRSQTDFAISPGHGIVSIHAIAAMGRLPNALSAVRGFLQGCAVASAFDVISGPIVSLLLRNGVSYICKPGRLQCPPLSWREDGRDVVRSLLAA